jgi:hypothetical protein
MPSPVVDAFQHAIQAKRGRPDPDLAVVAHCIAQALALTNAELEAVTAGVRAAIAKGTCKVSVRYDATGKIDETKLPPLPLLPATRVHPKRATGSADSSRVVERLIGTCATLTPKELTLVTQGVRAAIASR